jgi:hypothetical protein
MVSVDHRRVRRMCAIWPGGQRRSVSNRSKVVVDAKRLAVAGKLVEEVSRHAPSFTAPASLEGATRIAPAAALMRCVHLLRDIVACVAADATEAAVLALRTLVETDLCGWYLLVLGFDAFKRMGRDQAEQMRTILNGLVS